jgi:hypothetical protein
VDGRYIVDVYKKHAAELEKNLDALGLVPSPCSVVIITDRPKGMPKEYDPPQLHSK